MTITLKDADGANGMRVAGRLASEVLDYLTPFVQPGVSTNELDKLAHDQCVPGDASGQRDQWVLVGTGTEEQPRVACDRGGPVLPSVPECRH